MRRNATEDAAASSSGRSRGDQPFVGSCDFDLSRLAGNMGVLTAVSLPIPVDGDAGVESQIVGGISIRSRIEL